MLWLILTIGWGHLRAVLWIIFLLKLPPRPEEQAPLTFHWYVVSSEVGDPVPSTSSSAGLQPPQCLLTSNQINRGVSKGLSLALYYPGFTLPVLCSALPVLIHIWHGWMVTLPEENWKRLSAASVCSPFRFLDVLCGAAKLLNDSPERGNCFLVMRCIDIPLAAVRIFPHT